MSIYTLRPLTVRDVKVQPCGFSITITYADGRESESLWPEDAIRRGEVLAGECMAASREGRLACPRNALIPAIDCEPKDGLLLAERLLLIACRVAMLGSQRVSQRVSLTEPDDDEDDRPDQDPSANPDLGGESVAEMIVHDLVRAGA
jgi:hypothetical protein